MGKPMRIKFIDKTGDWVEELCHDLATCREHKRKVAKSVKSLKAAEDAKNLTEELNDYNAGVQSLEELLLNFEEDDNNFTDEEQIPERDITVCLSKNGINNCRYHSQLYKIERELEEAFERVKIDPSKEALDRYAQIFSHKEKIVDLITVSEYGNFNVGLKYVNADLNDSMKKILTKDIDSISIDDIEWTSYVKAAINFTSPQSYGAKCEGIYRRKKGYEKVNPSDEKGDAFSPVSKKHFEIKFTVVSYPSYQYDIVQIRPHHKVNDYHIIAFNKDDDTTEFYILSKKQMEEELIKTGRKLAHGSLKNQSDRTYPEYSIRFKRGSEIHKRWKKYLKPVDWN